MAALLGAASSAETQTGSTARLCCHQGANDTPAIRMLAQVPEEQEVPMLACSGKRTVSGTFCTAGPESLLKFQTSRGVLDGSRGSKL
eukprot:scaffold28490_cov15-Tisochrysis_lutea.AAC.1